MRPLEILLAVLVGVCFLRPLMPARWRWPDFLPAAALIVAVLQIIIEGYRWQMLPLYLLALGLFIFYLPRMFRPRPAASRPAGNLEPGTPSGTSPVSGRAILYTALGLLATGLALALPLVLPIPQAPAPTGPYPVGTLTLALTDESRRELYGSDPNAPRRFLAQLWYPAQIPAGAETAPWMEDAGQVSPAIARWVGLPAFSLGHLRYAASDSYSSALLSGNVTRYPVLLFSHGWGGFRAQSTFLMQELASHGYVVVGLEHPYGSLLTVFPDGSVVPNNPQALPVDAPPAELQAAAQRLVDQWAGDLGYTLDVLVGLNADDPVYNFTGRLDLDHVGVLGHSTGGGAAIQFCGRDPRCQAGLGLDAYMTPVSPAVLDSGLAQPFLALFSELWPSQENLNLYRTLQSHSPQATWLALLGADHYDFTDLPMLTPLAHTLGLKGPLDGQRALRVIDDYALAFFNQELKNEPSTVLDGPSPAYPEIRWEQPAP
jgi:predicted dienelactone hydrolase